MGQEEPIRNEVIMAGVGGRGILFAGFILAQAAMAKYRHVLWFPSYSAVVRGGACECTVVLSNNSITSPILPKARSVIVMDTSQVKPFESRVRPGGLMIVESAGLSEKVQRKDISVFYIPGIKQAVALGSAQVGNLFLLGAYLEVTKVVSPQSIDKALEKELAIRGREQLLALNKKALREGMRLAKETV